MFKVKATVTGYGKDETKGPCHMRLRIGDEVVYNGETISGRVCPNMMAPLARAFAELFASGGRHKEGEAPGSYYPFWHSPQSVYDPAYKKYDGVGFRPTLERPEEGYKFVADKTLFDNPPGGKWIIGKGTEKKDISLTCGDSHTFVQFKVEAFDLADHGDALPYFRRAMTILNKVVRKPGIAMDKIIDEFTPHDRDNIYPSLGQNIIAILVGELEVLGYVVVENSTVTATEKGKKKLASFIESLTAEEKEALKL
ncbi:MAG TPA: TIGR04076 family protein [Dehalococcoidia bacterium]|nr:TIGR04076 family protein [Dehalococcoidia bacterium]